MLRTTIFAGVIAGLTVLTGCAGKPFDLQGASAGSNLSPVAITTSAFAIQTLLPRSGTEGRSLRVYIEGDGRAWITSRTPSDDPTPRKSMMAAFALADDGAAYMARPCQFIWSAGCNIEVWTGARFSEAVITAHNEALDAIKARLHVDRFELVGYSGGAAVALLLAARRDDVKSVQTLAGLLDHRMWTDAKSLEPLDASLNPPDYADVLQHIPQRHIIGVHDSVIPGDVLYGYTLKVQPLCAVTVEADAGHHGGYDEIWDHVKDRPIVCGNR